MPPVFAYTGLLALEGLIEDSSGAALRLLEWHLDDARAPLDLSSLAGRALLEPLAGQYGPRLFGLYSDGRMDDHERWTGPPAQPPDGPAPGDQG
jgi:hypothetical protein